VDIRALVDTARAKGLSFRVDGDRIKVEAPTEPDPETKALLDTLRTHKADVKRILLPPPCWNCGATMTRTKDINGTPWWACWECAKTA
jgi:hypothetical protein